MDQYQFRNCLIPLFSPFFWPNSTHLTWVDFFCMMIFVMLAQNMMKNADSDDIDILVKRMRLRWLEFPLLESQIGWKVPKCSEICHIPIYWYVLPINQYANHEVIGNINMSWLQGISIPIWAFRLLIPTLRDRGGRPSALWKRRTDDLPRAGHTYYRSWVHWKWTACGGD